MKATSDGTKSGARLDSVGNLPRDRLGRGARRGVSQDCQEGSVRRDRGGGLRRLEEEIEKPENEPHKLQFEVQRLELQGTLALKNGDAIKGLMP